MKGSTILLIASGAVVAGVIAYGVYKYFQEEVSVVIDEPVVPDNSSDLSSASGTYSTAPDKAQTVVSEFEQVQKETVDSIREHHREAAQELENTLNEMAVDCAEFDEKINQANDDLDELLK